MVTKKPVAKRVGTSTARKVTRPSPLDEALKEYDAAKRDEEAATARVKKAQEDVMRLIVNQPGEKHTVNLTGGKKIMASLVRGTRVVIDEGRLKKALGMHLWNKITVRTIDKTKLDALVKTGDISATVLAGVSEVKENAPYVRITRK